jgi:uncharacterized protein YuzE
LGTREGSTFFEGIVLDYDTDGRIVGMEVLDARQHLPPAVLVKAA